MFRLQDAMFNYETKLLRQVVRGQGPIAGHRKWMFRTLLRTCASKSRKIISELVTFSRDIYKSKNEGLLAFFKDSDNFSAFNAATTLQIVEKWKNVTLNNNPPVLRPVGDSLRNRLLLDV